MAYIGDEVCSTTASRSTRRAKASIRRSWLVSPGRASGRSNRGGHMRRAVRRWCVRIVPPLGLLIWATLPVIGQSGTESGAKAGEWTTYGGDLANTRYAPL